MSKEKQDPVVEMKNCENCGCRVYNGLCVNCHEESYIFEQNYSNDEPISFSNEFMEKVSEQRKVRSDHQRQLDKGDTLDYDIEDDFITKRR